MATLQEEMQTLFDNNDEISTIINTGKLPLDLADIAAQAMTENSKLPSEIDFPDADYLTVGMVVSQKFFPQPLMGAVQARPALHAHDPDRFPDSKRSDSPEQTMNEVGNVLNGVTDGCGIVACLFVGFFILALLAGAKKQ
jgi:hypothetical protein